MKNHYEKLIFLFLSIMAVIKINGQEININIGFKDSIHSEILNETRNVFIHLPQNYDPQKSYPVLFRLDGDPDLLMETVVTTNRLTYGDEIAPEIIVVAIENTNRARDMWPTNCMFYPEPYEAGAKEFLNFFDEELIPYIDSKYSTREKILCGQSLSGVFTLFAFLTQPKLFDSYIISSGAFPGCHEYFAQLYTHSFSKPDQFTGQEIFITNGLLDPLDADGTFQQEIADFSNTMKEKLGNRIRHKYLTYENEGHVPFHSLYDGLKFIFQSK